MTTPELHRSRPSESQDLNDLSVPAADRTTAGRLFDTARTFINRTAGVTALTGASFFGGAGLVGPTADTARGGMVLTSGDDPAARERGSQMSGLYQGPGLGGSMHVLLEFDGLNGRETKFGGTAIAFNRYGLIASGHQFIDYVNRNLTIKVGTGPNYLTDPGTYYDISDLFIHPGYTGPDSRFTNPDLAVLRYASPVNQSAEMVFANARPAAGTDLTWAGFGRPGILFQEYLEPDGAARGGLAEATGFPPLAGESADIYIPTTIPFTGGDLVPTTGSSGSPLFDGSLLTGMYTRSGGSPFTEYGLYLDLSRPERQEFILDRLAPTSVPEPSSLLFVGAAVSALVLSRRFASNRGGRPNEDH